MVEAGPEGATRLRQEREQASFDPEALHVVLSGGAEKLEEWNRVMQVMRAEPLFDKTMDPYRSRTERHVRALGKALRLRELKREHGWSTDEFWSARRMAGEVLPDDVHFSMFVPNVMSMCSDAQQAH